MTKCNCQTSDDSASPGWSPRLRIATRRNVARVVRKACPRVRHRLDSARHTDASPEDAPLRLRPGGKPPPRAGGEEPDGGGEAGLEGALMLPLARYIPRYNP